MKLSAGVVFTFLTPLSRIQSITRDRLVLMPLIRAVVLVASLGGPAWAQPPTHLWSQRFGDSNSQFIESVAVDPSGNVLVTGWFMGTVDFGGGPLVSAGSEDVFIAKFTPGGAHLWSKRFGNNSAQRGAQVSTDPAGNIIAAGFFDGTVNFGGSTLTSAGQYDAFVAEFTPAGAHVWSKRFGDADWQYALTIAADPLGNVVVGGFFDGVMDLGGGPLTSAGHYDAFAAGFTSGGAHLWSHSFGDTLEQRADGVATDASGNVVITGSFQGTVDFGGGPMTSAGAFDVFFDIFVAKFNSSGAHVWSKRFGDGTASQVGRTTAVDVSGNVVLAGLLRGSVDFGGGPITSGGADDIFLAKLNSGGSHVWSKAFGGANTQNAFSVAVGHSSGYVALTGYFLETVDFGGGPLTAPAGMVNAFLSLFKADGTHVWSKGFGNSGSHYGYGVGMDATENVIVGVTTTGALDFGGGILISAGAADCCVAKFAATPTGVVRSPSPALSISAYPNPFNPEAVIEYTVPARGRVQVAIYDVNGAHVATLVDEDVAPGPHATRWDGKDKKRGIASSGVYLARIVQGGSVRTAKITLLK